MLKRLFHSQSGRKSQVVSIDYILAYLIFAMFLFYVSNYIITLSSPFSSYVKSSVLYKDSSALAQSFSFRTISKEVVNGICMRNISGVRLVNAGYLIKGALLPAFDAVKPAGNGIYIVRQGDMLNITFHTGQSDKFEFIVLTSNSMSKELDGFESDDSADVEKKDYGYDVVVFSRTSASDYDTIILKNLGNSYVLFNYFNSSNVYLGDELFNYSCIPDLDINGRSSFYSGFSSMKNGIVVNSWAEVWWN